MKLLFFLALTATSGAWAIDSTIHSKCQDYLQKMRALRIQQDSTQFESLKLAGGAMDVLLISNPQADKAAAAVSVGVGFYEDPPGMEGFFHKFEHTIFLGSHSYPEGDAVMEFVQQHHGMSNAYTSNTETNYHFDILPSAFDGALHRLSALIFQPLFRDDRSDNENSILQAEYLKYKEDRNSKLSYLFQFLNDPEHPHHRLFQGNLDTLTPVTGRLLREAHRKYYFPGNMKVVLMGPQSIETLRSLAKKHFDQQDRRGPLNLSYPVARKPLRDEPLIVHWNTPDQGHHIQLNILIDPTHQHHWHSRSADLLTRIIASEEETSLSQQLQRRGLIGGLTAHADVGTEHLDRIIVDIHATEQGYKQWSDIVHTTLFYISQIARVGLDPKFLLQQQRMGEMQYAYTPLTFSIRSVASMASSLWKHTPDELLESRLLLPVPNAEEVQMIARQARNPNAIQVYLGSPDEDGDEITELYEVIYRIGDPNQISLSPDNKLGLQFSTAPLNPYIPESIDSLALQKSGRGQISTNARSSFSFDSSSVFANIRTFLQVTIDSPADVGIQDFMMNRLAIAYLEHSLLPLIEKTSQVGSSLSLSRDEEDNWTIQLSSYSALLPNLVDDMLKQLSSVQMPEDQYQQFIMMFGQGLQNEELGPAYSQSVIELKRSIHPVRFSRKQMLEALDFITQEQLQEHIRERIAQSHLRSHAFGGVDEPLAQQLSAKLDTLLGPESSSVRSASAHLKMSLLDLIAGKRGVAIRHRMGLNNAVAVAVDLGRVNDPVAEAVTTIISSAFPQQFFDEIRTQRGNVYIAQMSVRPIKDHLVSLFLVQSSEHAQELGDAVHAWIDTLPQKSLAISEEHFENFKNMAIEVTTLPNPNIFAEANEQQVLRQLQRPPSWKSDVVAALQAMTFEGWQEHVRRLFNAKTSTRLSTYVIERQKQVQPLREGEIPIAEEGKWNAL